MTLPIDVETALRFSPRLYAAVVDPNGWPDVLKELSDLFGADVAQLSFFRSADVEIVKNIQVGMTGEMIENWRRFDESWHKNSFRAEAAILPNRPLIDSERVPSSVVHPSKILLSALGQDLLAHALAVVIDIDGENWGVAVGLARRPGKGPWSTSDTAKLRLLVPHLRQSAVMARRVHDKDMMIGTVLARLSVGVIIVDQGLHVHVLNPAADDILSLHDGIGVEAGRLAVPASAHRRNLHERLRALEQTAPARDAFHNDVFYLPRPSGLPPWSVTVLPGARVGARAQVPGAYATLIIADPLRSPLPAEEALIRQFGLTLSEAKVARLTPLALGKRQIAEQLGLSENTVKSHLAHAREKIGARNMHELGLIIARSTL